MRTKKRFGQHLLNDPEDAIRIAELVETGSTDSRTVLEIGPGSGALTEKLLATLSPEKLIAVEFDRDMVAALKVRFPQLHILQQDILDYNPNSLETPVYAVGNLPYNISAPILDWTVRFRNTLSGAVYMLQREVADRLAGQSGSKDWSPLAIFTQLHFAVAKAFNLPPEKFSPPPKVHSTVVILKRREPFDFTLPENFELVVRTAFSSRRKLLSKNLQAGFNISSEKVRVAMEASNLAPTIRAEQISIAQFIELSHNLAGIRSRK